MRRIAACLCSVFVIAASPLLWGEEVITVPIRTFVGHYFPVSSAVFSPDGMQVLTGSGDATAKLWNASTGACVRTLSGHTDGVWSVAFSPDGTQVLTGSADRTAVLWNAFTGASIRPFSGHTDWVMAVAFSRDGMQVLTGSCDNTAKLWNAATGECTHTFSGHTEYVRSVAFSPDGSQVLTGSDDKTAKLWSISTGECIRTFVGHTQGVSSAVFSPNGAQVLTGSADYTAKLWDASTGVCTSTLPAHAGGVCSVAFSPNGAQLLTGSIDGTARLCHTSSGSCIRIFAGHASYVLSVAFSPNGKQALTGSMDGTAMLWQTGLTQLTVVNGTGSGAYPTGTVVPIAATVPQGYGFSQWTGDVANVVDIHAASTTITLLADATVTATFVRLGSISGTVWFDRNGNKARDADEPGLQPWIVYIDKNGDAQFDKGEEFAVTDANGAYTIGSLPAGTHIVAQLASPGYVQTWPSGPAHALVVAEGQDVADVNFGNRSYLGADVNGDGCVNVADLLTVRNNLGKGSCH